MEVVAQIVSNQSKWNIFRGVKWLWTKNRPLTIGVVVVFAAVKIRDVIKRRQKRLEWARAGQDVVILHGLGQGLYSPSVSPYVMKLATYLRMADIEYKMDFTEPLGPKGKSPWITINGKSIGDSQLIMDYLGSHFNKDFSSHLGDEQKAVAWSFTIMVDEHLAWTLKDWRWVRDGGRGVIVGIGMRLSMFSRLPMMRLSRKQKGMMVAQGIGRHNHKEIESFALRHFRALSNYLGNKPFLTGDEPSEVDCSVFGCLVQIRYNYPGSPYTTMLEHEYPNLGAYVNRMKERFWPDWDHCLLTPNLH